MPEERYERTTLHSPGSVPGIPGTHGPGPVVIDWEERRITTLQEWNDAQTQLTRTTKKASKTASSLEASAELS